MSTDSPVGRDDTRSSRRFRPIVFLVAVLALHLTVVESVTPAVAEAASIEVVDDAVVFRRPDGSVFLRQEPRGVSFTSGGRRFTATSVALVGPERVVWRTSDPAATIEASLADLPDGSTTVSVRVLGRRAEKVTMAFASGRDERFFGFGERSDAVERRGRDTEHYVAEGPFLAGDYPILRTILPPPGLRERPDATYYPVPWLLSSRGYGVLVTDDARSTHDLAKTRTDAWSVTVDAGEANLRVFPGPTPADALASFSAATGRQPDTGSAATLGPWVQPSGSTNSVQAVTEWAERTDSPLSVVQTYLHYLPCGDHRGIPPAERRREPAIAHDAGIAITTYLNPMVCETFEESFQASAAADALTRTSTGEPYVYDYFGSKWFRVGQYDFASPQGGEMFRDVAHVAVADGYDGWMEDFGEYTPLDAVDGEGVTGTAGHNAYVRHYRREAHQMQVEVDRPLLRFSRSGWTGAAQYAPIVWGGDPSTSWGFDGLRSTVSNGLSMGMSGVGIWGSDIGGYFTLTGPKLTHELLSRWIEVGAFSGVMRLQGNGFGGSGRPQVFEGESAAVWRRYAKLRTQLAPYLQVAADEYRDTGLPLMRHPLLTDPGDAAAKVDDAYRFGDSFFVAPILDPGSTSRPVTLPSGRWFDLTESLRFDERTGAFTLGDVPVVDGGRTVQRTAAVHQIPLYVEAGTVVSLLPADVDSLADQYAAGRSVAASERSDRRRLLAFPDGSSSIEVEPGETATSDVTADGTWTLDLAGAPAGRVYDVHATLRAIPDAWPCDVTVAGKPVTAWNWDASTEVFTVSAELAAGPLVVRRCEAPPPATTPTSTPSSTPTGVGAAPPAAPIRSAANYTG